MFSEFWAIRYTAVQTARAAISNCLGHL